MVLHTICVSVGYMALGVKLSWVSYPNIFACSEKQIKGTALAVLSQYRESRNFNALSCHMHVLQQNAPILEIMKEMFPLLWRFKSLEIGM